MQYEFNYRFARPLFALSCLLIGIVFLRTPLKKSAIMCVFKADRGMSTRLSRRMARDIVANQSTAMFEIASQVSNRNLAAHRIIVLCWPKFSESDLARKGILIIKFTETFGYFHLNIDTQLISEFFHIVLEPSSSGYADADILSWVSISPSPVFIESTEIADRIFISSLGSNLVPVSFGASNWANPEFFKTTDSEKLFDALYIANTSPVKRVMRFIQACDRVSKIAPTFRAALVCAAWGGGNVDDFRLEIDRRGLADIIVVHEKIPRHELVSIISASKLSLLLSYKEGSSKVLFESMFVDVPVLCIAENSGVNKSYINEHTGYLINDSCLEQCLLGVTSGDLPFSPRLWAERNLSPRVTTKSLLSVISAYTSDDFGDGGDVLVKINDPEFKYVDYPDLDISEINLPLLEVFETATQNDKEIGPRLQELERQHHLACQSSTLL